MSRLREFLHHKKEALVGRRLGGQGLVEFSLVLPLLLLMIFVIVELGRMFFAWMAIENGARMAVRFAITGQYDPTKCASGCFDADELRQVRVASIEDVAQVGSTGIMLDTTVEDPTQAGFFNVAVCSPPNELSIPAGVDQAYGCIGAENAGSPGQNVIVAVEYNHPLIVPILSSAWPQVRLSARRQSRVEIFGASQVGSALPAAPPAPPAPPPGPPVPTPVPCSDERISYPKGHKWADMSMVGFYSGIWACHGDDLGATLVNNSYYPARALNYTLTWRAGNNFPSAMKLLFFQICYPEDWWFADWTPAGTRLSPASADINPPLPLGDEDSDSDWNVIYAYFSRKKMGYMNDSGYTWVTLGVTSQFYIDGGWSEVCTSSVTKKLSNPCSDDGDDDTPGPPPSPPPGGSETPPPVTPPDD